jgi:hypothetical protein
MPQVSIGLRTPPEGVSLDLLRLYLKLSMITGKNMPQILFLMTLLSACDPDTT